MHQSNTMAADVHAQPRHKSAANCRLTGRVLFNTGKHTHPTMLRLVSQGSRTWPWSVSSTSWEPRLGVANAEAACGRHMQPARKPPPISVPPQYLHV